jgi:DNA-binding MarR family transcriptional regulator
MLSAEVRPKRNYGSTLAAASPLGGTPFKRNSGKMNDQGGHERLLQLSDEISRIATTLAQLSSDFAPLNVNEPGNGSATPIVHAELLHWLITSRRQRAKYLPKELFAEPAWDMLLELLHAEVTRRRVSISALCAASGVPATTALRWVNLMTERGLFLRRDDRSDARRAFVELAPAVSIALRRYFTEVVRSNAPPFEQDGAYAA